MFVCFSLFRHWSKKVTLVTWSLGNLFCEKHFICLSNLNRTSIGQTLIRGMEPELLDAVAASKKIFLINILSTLRWRHKYGVSYYNQKTVVVSFLLLKICHWECWVVAHCAAPGLGSPTTRQFFVSLTNISPFIFF